MKKSEQKRPIFLDARLTDHRMVSETLVTPEGRLSPSPRTLKTKTISSLRFDIAADSPDRPAKILVRLTIEVSLRDDETGGSVADYSAQYANIFNVVAHQGVDDWTTPSGDAFSPYAAMLSLFAERRCETVLLAAGLYGARVPRSADFNGALSPLAPLPTEVPPVDSIAHKRARRTRANAKKKRKT